MSTGIYRISNTISGKIYIGQAADILQRWRQHRNKLVTGVHPNPRLQASWNKHGAAAFTFEIIKLCDVADLGREEIAALEPIPETVRFNIGVAGDNPTLGLARSALSKLRQSRARGGRPFFATNLTTGEVQRFEYSADAERDLNIDRSKIFDCVHGRSQQAGGYSFHFDPTVPSEPKWVSERVAKEKRNREVIGTDIASGVEIRFAFVAAVKTADFAPSGVYKCLSGEMQTHKGYTWRYADGLPHKSLSASHRAKLHVGPRKHGGSRAVIGTHTETGREIRFEYVKAAAEHVGVSAPYIHHCLAGKMKKAGGYVWRLAEPEN